LAKLAVNRLGVRGRANSAFVVALDALQDLLVGATVCVLHHRGARVVCLLVIVLSFLTVCVRHIVLCLLALAAQLLAIAEY
jgi:hypothetical protein